METVLVLLWIINRFWLFLDVMVYCISVLIFLLLFVVCICRNEFEWVVFLGNFLKYMVGWNIGFWLLIFRIFIEIIRVLVLKGLSLFEVLMISEYVGISSRLRFLFRKISFDCRSISKVFCWFFVFML